VNVNVNINENLINPFKKEPINIRNKNLTTNLKGPISPKNYKINYEKSDENKSVKIHNYHKNSTENWMKYNKGMTVLVK